MAAPPNRTAAKLGSEGGGGNQKGPPAPYSPTSTTASGDLVAGLEQWAKRHGARLADEFVSNDRDGQGDPAEFFAKRAGRLALTATYRAVAEPAFMERLVELEARR